MNWHNPIFEEQLARVRAAAALHGLIVERCPDPPYGWDLLDAQGNRQLSGPLPRLEQHLLDVFPGDVETG